MSQLPANAPFGHEQKVALQALLPTLQPAQATWLSGYFAALGGVGGAATATPAAAPAAQAAPAAGPTVPMTVLFGSESGNSEALAQEVDKAARSAGFKSKVYDMADYPREQLEKEENVLVVVSTWGEGDPPETASEFYEWILSDAAPKLEKTRFSVCALGDTSYADFCECGKQIDQRMAALGAERVSDRVDCDVDYEAPFRTWLDAVMPLMVDKAGVKEAMAKAEATSAPAVAVAAPAGMAFEAAPAVEAYSKKNPFMAEVKTNFTLNGRDSKKQTIHVELSLEGSGMTYEPGDVLGVFPTNSPDVVDDFVRLAGFRGDEIREIDGEYKSLAELLATEYDITGLNKLGMKKYAELAKHKALDRLLSDEQKEACNEYLWGRELRDLFLEFPPADNLSLDQLLGLLRKMPPRLYSIASSNKAHPDEVHLTVAAVRYETNGLERKGVCSTYLSDRSPLGSKMPVYLHHNKNFKLPTNPETPIIMVGPGTGIAPFRAFIEERAEVGAQGKSWLFFGDWTFQDDFLYQTEWQDYLKKGLLTQMDVAFSRDGAEKVYVQHRMQEKGKQLWEWLQEGAHFYVCGDASRMAKDVHATLHQVAEEHGGMSREEAEKYIKSLQKEKRYQRDVY